MFVLGTAAHSRDYRMSAGGFVHGFRYTGTFQTKKFSLSCSTFFSIIKKQLLKIIGLLMLLLG